MKKAQDHATESNVQAESQLAPHKPVAGQGLEVKQEEGSLPSILKHIDQILSTVEQASASEPGMKERHD